MNEVKKDCFAYVEIVAGRGKCRCLEKLYCAEGKCKFYKKNRCDGGCLTAPGRVITCSICKKEFM